MSTPTDTEKAAKRRLQLQEAQARARARKRNEGSREIRVTLTREEFERFQRQQEKASVPLEAFAKLALVRGGAFVANAGNVRGGKVKEKGTAV